MKKLSITLNHNYKSFKAGFKCELEATNNLIIISGVNGSGKSQLGEIIYGWGGGNSSVELITASRKVRINHNNSVYENINGTINNAQNIRNLLSSDNYLGSPLVNPDSHISIHQKIRTQVAQYETIIDENIYRICKAIMENTSKTWDQMSDISDDEINNQLKALNLNDLSSPFANTLQNIFKNYAVNLDDKRYKCYMDEVSKEGKEGVEEEHRNEFGFDKMEPWKFLNKALLELNLDYEFIEPKVIERTANIDSIKIKNKTNDFIAENDFNFLSSGEKTILSLLFSLMNTKGIKPQVIVLDEYDATLNPSLTEKFYKILEEYFISKDVLVIIITHSVATISMAPDYSSFYEVFKESSRIVKVEKDKYSDMQKALIKYYETEENLRKLVTNLEMQIKKSSDKSIIICEGKTDPKHLTKAMKKLGKTIDNIEFIGLTEGKSNSGLSALKGLLKHLSIMPRSNKIIGIFDRDELGNVSEIEANNKKHKSYGNDVYAFCIPEIEFKNEKGDAVETAIEIEHLYPINIIKTKVKTEAGDRRLFLGSEFLYNGESECGIYHMEGANFKNKKINLNHIIDGKVYLKTEYVNKLMLEKKNYALSKSDFANAIEDDAIFTSEEDFKNFKPIFELIERIINEKPSA